MARRLFNDGMEITYSDLVAISQAMERDIYDRVIYKMLQEVDDAFFGAGFLVSRTSATQLSVAAGSGFQEDTDQDAPEGIKRVLNNSAAFPLEIDTPHATLDRIDIVVVKHARANTLSDTRKFKSATTDAVTNETFVLETDWQADIDVTTGTPGASPSAPATPAGYLKIAEVYVTAATGIAASGAITDTRSMLPVGGDSLIDSSAFIRLPANVSQSVKSILASVDSQINIGRAQNLRWNEPAGYAPLMEEENGEQVFLFADGSEEQRLTAFIRVPENYIAGTPISMSIGQYSPSSSNTQLLKARCYLIRKNTDAVTSTTNLHTTTNAALTNTVANMYRLASLDLSDSDGEINSVAVAANDLLRVELYRDQSNDTDTADVRFIPAATSVRFGA